MSASLFGFWVTCRRCERSWICDHTPQGDYYARAGEEPLSPKNGLCLNCLIGAPPGAVIQVVQAVAAPSLRGVMVGNPIARFPSITCPRCGRTSYHPVDIAEGYCSACGDWTTMRY